MKFASRISEMFMYTIYIYVLKFNVFFLKSIHFRKVVHTCMNIYFTYRGKNIQVQKEVKVKTQIKGKLKKMTKNKIERKI